MSTEQLLTWSEAVEKNLVSTSVYSEAVTIASYVAKRDEVQTRGIIEHSIAAGKRVVVPVTETRSHRLLFFEINGMDELSPGAFGVQEPVRRSHPIPLDETDLVLVPLLAWDERGHRLGYGMGYFDTELFHRGKSLAIGLALESQRVENIPQVSSDVPLDAIVTEKRVIRFAAAEGGPR